MKDFIISINNNYPGIIYGFVGAALFDLIKYIIRKVRKNK